jgi:RNA polymerase sigma-70 factor (ECF subfamily)
MRQRRALKSDLAGRTGIESHSIAILGSSIVSPHEIAQASQQHFGRIHRAALVLTGNPWDADDLAQETFLVLARAADRFAGRSAVYTWLYGILLNLERRERRRIGARRRKLHVLWANESTSDRASPAAETPLEVAEWKKSLWAKVAELPDGQRQTLVLRFSERLSYEEIALVLECPLGTVKSRIFHGLAALRELLDADHDLLRIPPHPQEDVNYAV